jgi:hypothetical protein
MDKIPRPHGPLNRDYVLPNAVGIFMEGLGTIEDVLELVYDQGLAFGFEAGVQAMALGDESPDVLVLREALRTDCDGAHSADGRDAWNPNPKETPNA